ncbi:MAG TPA: histidine kinase [Anaerolineales bacterium]|nr:histidine kinase [Anaerolineales bacterium]
MKNGRTRIAPEKAEGLCRHIFSAVTDGLILLDLVNGRVLYANPAACAMHDYTHEEFIGLLPGAFLHPDSQREFNRRIQALRSGVEFDTQLLHVRRDSSTFHAEWRGAAFTFQGRRCLLGIVRDVTRQIQANQRLRQRFESRTREQSALLEISHTLASTLELQPDEILEQLRSLFEFTQAALFGLTDSTLNALAVRGAEELEGSSLFQVRLEGPETLAALYNGHRPIRIADIDGADPAAVFLRSLLTGEAAGLLEGVRAWMWVPLAVEGRIIGGLGVAHARRNYFTPHHAALALSMADQVAITMVNAELYEHARSLAALQERQRLAQDLHDAVNQSLFSAALIAEVLPRLWNRDPVEAQQSLEDLRRLTRGALAEMRALLAELRPSVLTDSGLGDLIRQQANAFTGRTNIPASVTIYGEYGLPAAVQVAYYRICQEALNNIAKHAGAGHVWINLQHASRAAQLSASLAHAGGVDGTVDTPVEMRIRDDGQGFDPGRHAVAGHYGLDMMLERAEAVGARLMVTSSPGHGTEITLRWPDISS